MLTRRYYELGEKFRLDTLIIHKVILSRAVSVRADSPYFFCLKIEELSRYYSE